MEPKREALYCAVFIFFLITTGLSLLVPAFLAIGQWWHASRKPHIDPTEVLPPISVIVAARDEAKNLPKLLPALLNLAYATDFEVVLVLDRCQDDSETIAREWARKHPRLKVHSITELPEGWTGKKWALEQGISQASHHHFALTDADCIPGTDWLNAIGQQFAQGKQLVLGLGLYRKRAGLLNKLVRFETHVTAMLYLGLASWHRPYMGVGRNLAYTRSFFERAEGMTSIANRLSGDDDLLVDRHAKSAETGWMVHLQSRTWSDAPPDWKAWWRQKTRHLSAGTGYRLGTQLILSVLNVVQVIFYLSLVVVLFGEWPLEIVLALYVLRTVLARIFWSAGHGFGMERDLSFWFPILELCYLLYILILVPASLVLKPKWRGK